MTCRYKGYKAWAIYILSKGPSKIRWYKMSQGINNFAVLYDFAYGPQENFGLNMEMEDFDPLKPVVTMDEANLFWNMLFPKH